MIATLKNEEKKVYTHFWFEVWFEPRFFQTVKAHVVYLNQNIDSYDFVNAEGDESPMSAAQRIVATHALFEKLKEIKIVL